MGAGTTNLWAQNQHRVTLNCNYYGITAGEELLYDIRCLIAMLKADMMARDVVRHSNQINPNLFSSKKR